ncbi:hypothetical protein [uncultured Caulobacter sp.]|uniref:hypothetical protein n=1 Tax=uncultured Caulobacter sp. TaxID=158749 RepID=UPI002627A8F7|nr:hypothetical protein [uncultured Caulobacter sp.]
MLGARIGALATLAAMALAGQALAEVTLDAAAQKRLGVTVAPLSAARDAGATNGYARVLDPVPLATLDSDLQAAAAAARASAAEAARTQALAAADATVARKVAEAARAQASADAAKLLLLRRRIALEWGRAFVADGPRARLLAELSAGRAALVRIDAPAGVADVVGARIDLGSGQSVPVAVLGPTRTADSRLGTGGLIGVARGPSVARLAVDLTAPAILSAKGRDVAGVLAPRSAVMRGGGAVFVYVREDPTHFERRVLTGVVPRAEGLFAAGGAKPGELVVVSGAAAIFATENAPKSED